MASGTKITGFETSMGIKKIPAYKQFLVSFKPELSEFLTKEGLASIKDRFILDIYTEEGEVKNSLLPEKQAIVPKYVTDDTLVFQVPPLAEPQALTNSSETTTQPNDESSPTSLPDVAYMVISDQGAPAQDGEEDSKSTTLHKEVVELEKSDHVEPTDIYNFSRELVDSLNKDKQLDVSVMRSQQRKSDLLPLFRNIQASLKRISFEKYKRFIDLVFFQEPINGFSESENHMVGVRGRRHLPFSNVDSYRVLKVATEAFLMTYSGITLDNEIFTDNNAITQDIASKGMTFSPSDKRSFARIWADYILPDNPNFQDTSGLYALPFLYLIRQKFSDLAIKENFLEDVLESFPNEIEEEGAGNICFGIIRERLSNPILLELIWSYWNEEGMLVQTINAITRRFQNMKGMGNRDPLAEMEITHLRPLNNILWGYIQDEQHRLSVVRRAYEYIHSYGFTLKGKVVANMNSADSRTNFLEAFHNLLRITAKYYVDTANRLVDPDAFPILNSLREIHFIISEGMHNQYGDMPTVARSEMLMQQWILARPELREFLPGRAAVPYPEPWMDRIASMCKLQGWTDTSPIHFHYLANFGEQLFLSIRFGDWSDPDRTAEDAAQWALFFREVVQGYVHSYKSATGVDLTITLVGNKVDARPPSYHLAQRLKSRQNGQASKPAQDGAPSKKNGVNKEWF
jgi:hypothetical protein